MFRNPSHQAVKHFPSLPSSKALAAAVVAGYRSRQAAAAHHRAGFMMLFTSVAQRPDQVSSVESVKAWRLPRHSLAYHLAAVWAARARLARYSALRAASWVAGQSLVLVAR